MIAAQDFAMRIAQAMAAVRDRLQLRVAAEVPPDVTVVATDDGIALQGVALGRRALTDPRLRDFAGLLR